jgi:hypothetical protein
MRPYLCSSAWHARCANRYAPHLSAIVTFRKYGSKLRGENGDEMSPLKVITAGKPSCSTAVPI